MQGLEQESGRQRAAWNQRASCPSGDLCHLPSAEVAEKMERGGRCALVLSTTSPPLHHLPTSPQRNTSSSFNEKGGWRSWRQSQCRASECSARSKSTRRLGQGNRRAQEELFLEAANRGSCLAGRFPPLQAPPTPAPVIGEAWQPKEGLMAPDECLPCTRAGGLSRAAE